MKELLVRRACKLGAGGDVGDPIDMRTLRPRTRTATVVRCHQKVLASRMVYPKNLLAKMDLHREPALIRVSKHLMEINKQTYKLNPVAQALADQKPKEQDFEDKEDYLEALSGFNHRIAPVIRASLSRDYPQP